jgi:hypothetical protein
MPVRAFKENLLRHRGVVSRVLLLSPLGKYTDLVAALKYLYEYTEDLSLQSRKTILILTDGIHDPPQGSLNADGSKAREETNRIAQDIRKEGWDVNLLEYPLSGQTQAGGAGSGDNLLQPSRATLKSRSSPIRTERGPIPTDLPTQLWAPRRLSFPGISER